MNTTFFNANKDEFLKIIRTSFGLDENDQTLTIDNLQQNEDGSITIVTQMPKSTDVDDTKYDALATKVVNQFSEENFNPKIEGSNITL